LKLSTIKKIIFTDVDGTILDEENNFQEIKPIISRLTTLGVALVFCSSKTRAEVEHYTKELDVFDPFIVENGGAIFVPEGYFSFSVSAKKSQGFEVLEIGLPYSIVREKLAKASANLGTAIVGFGDMSVEEIASDANLPLYLARLAKEREYDEPFRLVRGDENEFAKAAQDEGLTITMGGKYNHALGNSNKGKAVSILKELFAKEFDQIVTFGLGDSENDLPMLAVVDKPFLVRRELNGRNAHIVAWNNVLRLIMKK
jgi:mannosyl-3-phosphoglycerate phosphatase